MAFKVTHNAQLIKLFLTHKSSLLHSFLMRRYPCMNIATKEFRERAFGILSSPRPKPILPAH